jgi:subtilisin family serine protease
MKKKWLLYVISITLIITIIMFNYGYYDSKNRIEESWESQLIGYKEIHKVVRGDNQTIVLIDSGISKSKINHLDKNISLVENEEQYDINGHGTMMYSLIKGSDNKIGICPKCKIISIKVMKKDESISHEIVAKAIDYAIQQNVTVINLSLGTYFENKLISDSVARAIENNIVIVASAGDYGTAEMLFPANLNGVISVGAINQKGDIWPRTNAINKVDISSPGVDVTVTNHEGEEFLSTGTSQSTAIISGYVALLKERKKDITIDEIKKILRDINENKREYSDFFHREEST